MKLGLSRSMLMLGSPGAVAVVFLLVAAGLSAGFVLMRGEPLGQSACAVGLLGLTLVGLRWVKERLKPIDRLRQAFDELSRSLELEIANRKLIEEWFSRERSFFRQVLDICPNFIFAKDRDGRFTLVNLAVAEAYGTTVADLLGKTDADFNTDAEQVAHFLRYDRHVMDSGQELSIEERITDSDGNVRYLHTVKRPISNQNGINDQVLGVSNDITQRKLYEQELSEHREHLEQLVEDRTCALLSSQEQLRRSERLALLGSLAAAVAHEINNPVGAMMLIAENSIQAVTEETDPDRIRALLERTSRRTIMHAKRCGAVVKGLLQFSRDHRGERSFCDVNELVRGAIELITESIDLRQSELRLELSVSIPEILVNPLAIEQVILNLVKNALQSRESNVQVTVRSGLDARGVLLEVSDNGSGITEAEMSHLFDPFYTTRSHKGGTGLGLSLVQRAITEHGGTIDIESTPGQGSRIVCHLPFALGSERTDQATHSAL